MKRDHSLNRIQIKYFSLADFTKACEFIAGVPSGTLEGILEGRVLSSSFINFALDSPAMGSHLLHFSHTNLHLSLSLSLFFFFLQAAVGATFILIVINQFLVRLS